MRHGVCGLVTLALAAGTALAPISAEEDRTLGRITYGMHCASCHGAEGTGAGPMAQFLAAPPPDLTTIQQDNGGVFPFARIYAIIESGRENPIHSASAMPAWGEEFVLQTAILQGVEIDPARRDAFVRGRILAVIDHIARFQQ